MFLRKERAEDLWDLGMRGSFGRFSEATMASKWCSSSLPPYSPPVCGKVASSTPPSFVMKRRKLFELVLPVIGLWPPGTIELSFGVVFTDGSPIRMWIGGSPELAYEECLPLSSLPVRLVRSLSLRVYEVVGRVLKMLCLFLICSF